MARTLDYVNIQELCSCESNDSNVVLSQVSRF